MNKHVVNTQTFLMFTELKNRESHFIYKHIIKSGVS